MRLLIAELFALPASALAAMQIEQNPFAAVGIMGVLILALGGLFKILVAQQKEQAAIILAAKEAALVQCERNKDEVVARMTERIVWLQAREADRDKQIIQMQKEVVQLLSGSTERMTIALQASTTALQALNEATTAHVHQAGAEHAALLDVIRRVASGALTPTEGVAEIERSPT